MENEVKLKMISDNNGGIISTNNAAESGISRMMLLNLCKNGIIVHIAHGQYILANEIQDEMLSVSMRSKNIIFSTKEPWKREKFNRAKYRTNRERE